MIKRKNHNEWVKVQETIENAVKEHRLAYPSSNLVTVIMVSGEHIQAFKERLATDATMH